MVRGLEIFRQHFKDFADNYIIIGGTACDIIIDSVGLTPRATKDIDIILVIEALSPEFVAHFWEFIKTGNYEVKEKIIRGIIEKVRITFSVLSLRRTKSWFPTFPTSRWSGILYSKNNQHITLLKVVENLMMLYIGMDVGGSVYYSAVFSFGLIIRLKTILITTNIGNANQAVNTNSRPFCPPLP